MKVVGTQEGVCSRASSCLAVLGWNTALPARAHTEHCRLVALCFLCEVGWSPVAQIL